MPAPITRSLNVISHLHLLAFCVPAACFRVVQSVRLLGTPNASAVRLHPHDSVTAAAIVVKAFTKHALRVRAEQISLLL
jgi:hypothetical protein